MTRFGDGRRIEEVATCPWPASSLLSVWIQILQTIVWSHHADLGFPCREIENESSSFQKTVLCHCVLSKGEDFVWSSQDDDGAPEEWRAHDGIKMQEFRAASQENNTLLRVTDLALETCRPEMKIYSAQDFF